MGHILAAMMPTFLSTPSARRATRRASRRTDDKPISIHALREEGDVIHNTRGITHPVFLSTPSARRATPSGVYIQRFRKFLSTPSARRATVQIAARRSGASHFYPRPPRGGRQTGFALGGRVVVLFYPRPPRGGRRQPHIGQRRFLQFLSTPSARRATTHIAKDLSISNISIHALREEGDPVKIVATIPGCKFLSTPSARRATDLILLVTSPGHISIHALREEGDLSSPIFWTAQAVFLSTPSARRATRHSKHRSTELQSFLSTPSARRATLNWHKYNGFTVFLSTPSARRATIA